MSKTILNCQDLNDRVLYLKKTRHDNDVIDCINMVYVKIEIELLGPIELDVVCYQNQTRQWRVRLYKYGQHQKWY